MVYDVGATFSSKFVATSEFLTGNDIHMYVTPCMKI